MVHNKAVQATVMIIAISTEAPKATPMVKPADPNANSVLFEDTLPELRVTTSLLSCSKNADEGLALTLICTKNADGRLTLVLDCNKDVG